MDLHHHQTYLIEEFAEAYREHRMGRRDLLKRVLYLTGGVATTATVLSALGCSSGSADEPSPAATTAPAKSAAAAVATTASGAGPGVAESDPAIEATAVRFPGPASEMLGYLARPSAEGIYAGIIVIHENRGLTDQTKDVVRRYAKEGFVALGVDLVSRRGGTTNDITVIMSALRASPEDLTADLKAGVDYLKKQPFVKASSLGAVGYCFGGAMTWELAIASPDIKAAVPYYGSLSARDLDALPQTQAAVFAVYAEEDTRITAQAPDVTQRLKAAGKVVETKVYPGVDHAFFNETGGSYNAEQAAAAMKDTLAWFRRYLTA